MLIRCLVLSLLVLSCGKDEQAQDSAASVQTNYGTVKNVTEYLGAINPHIRMVGQIQQQVDQQVGTSGQATGMNLSQVMVQARPQLEEVKAQLIVMTPPPKLTSLHKDILTMIDLRLEAYSVTIDGWEQEKTGGGIELYEAAQGKLDQANKLILSLNQQMQQINQTLLQTLDQPIQVASP
jgi:hypothetical protein